MAERKHFREVFFQRTSLFVTLIKDCRDTLFSCPYIWHIATVYYWLLWACPGGNIFNLIPCLRKKISILPNVDAEKYRTSSQRSHISNITSLKVQIANRLFPMGCCQPSSTPPPPSAQCPSPPSPARHQYCHAPLPDASKCMRDAHGCQRFRS